MGLRSLKRVVGFGGFGNDRGLVWWTFGSLTGQTWVIVITVAYRVTAGSYPNESNGYGGDSGLLSGLIVGVKVVLKW